MKLTNFYIEIQKQILKRCMKEQTKKPLWGEYKNNIFISFDGSLGFLIPEEFFFIDKQRLTDALGKTSEKSIGFVLEKFDNENLKEIEFVGIVINKNNIEMAVFRNKENSLTISIDYKNIKPFIDKNCKIEAYKEKELVKISMEETFCAVAMSSPNEKILF